ncbi:MAG: tryptophan--tRNA ligase [Deltaproteobacteria bacterium]|nr:tryptophan--tRNA ligase [Deltaproteobacteria bacterium]NIS78293.1 tryptophan--tRNA ligase [Deltaproteobacteria bacterium]
MSKKIVLSGMRPTGKLHLGNYFGATVNWVELQERGDTDCFYFVADWHSLTTDYDSTEEIAGNIKEMVADWLACGIDPEKSTIFIQSAVKEHAELNLILSMITPLPWLERNPTYKEQMREQETRDLHTYGFLGYPVLQAADIIMYKANLVPVGIDQVPHVELTREIARRFNHFYGEVFPLPEPYLTETPKLLGIDNRKMSKSYDNAIYLSDSEEELNSKVMEMITDPQRKRRSDPGNPEICNVFSFHKMFSEDETVQRIRRECQTAEIGCVECKRIMAEGLNRFITPIRDKRSEILKNESLLNIVFDRGSKRAGERAVLTMRETREAIGI